MHKSIPINQKYKIISKVLLLVLIILTMFDRLPYLKRGEVGLVIHKYRVLPILWTAFIVSIIFFIPKVHPMGRIRNKGQIYFEAMICVIILLAFRYAAGFLIYELGNSPYDLTPKGVFNNFINILPPLMARELIRGYLLNTYYNKKKIYIFYLIVALFSLLSMEYKSLSKINDIKTATIYFAESFGPIISENILLTYVALYGGGQASVVYVLISFVFHWAFPVLPILNWLSEGVIGIIIPIAEVYLLLNKYRYKSYRERHQEMHTGEMISMGFTLIISVLVLWFVVGVFPVYPSVIATGSMEPLIQPGDIILINKVMKEADLLNLEEGNIIQFRRDNILITHRIIEVVKDESGNISYRTKGDNNSAEDIRHVLPEEVKGTLAKVIPKIGYPTLWLKERRTLNKNDIEF